MRRGRGIKREQGGREKEQGDRRTGVQRGSLGKGLRRTSEAGKGTNERFGRAARQKCFHREGDGTLAKNFYVHANVMYPGIQWEKAVVVVVGRLSSHFQFSASRGLIRPYKFTLLRDVQPDIKLRK